MIAEVDACTRYIIYMLFLHNITFPNTKKTVDHTTRSGVFLTKFEVFGNVTKHYLKCLIYLLNRTGVNGEIKS